MHFSRPEVNIEFTIDTPGILWHSSPTSQSGRISGAIPASEPRGSTGPGKEKDHVEGDDVCGDAGGLGPLDHGGVGERVAARAPGGAEGAARVAGNAGEGSDPS